MRFPTTAMAFATLIARRRNRPAANPTGPTTGRWLARLGHSLRRLTAMCKRRAEQDDAFYRNLAAYCRANKVTPVCEDDWKTRG